MLQLFQRFYYNVFYGNFCQVDNIWNIFFQIIPVEIKISHFPQIKLVDYLYVVGDHFLGEVEQAGNLVTVFTGNTVNVFVDQKDFVIQLIQILAESLEFGYLIVFTCAQNGIVFPRHFQTAHAAAFWNIWGRCGWHEGLFPIAETGRNLWRTCCRSEALP